MRRVAAKTILDNLEAMLDMTLARCPGSGSALRRQQLRAYTHAIVDVLMDHVAAEMLSPEELVAVFVAGATYTQKAKTTGVLKKRLETYRGVGASQEHSVVDE